VVYFVFGMTISDLNFVNSAGQELSTIDNFRRLNGRSSTGQVGSKDENLGQFNLCYTAMAES